MYSLDSTPRTVTVGINEEAPARNESSKAKSRLANSAFARGAREIDDRPSARGAMAAGCAVPILGWDDYNWHHRKIFMLDSTLTRRGECYGRWRVEPASGNDGMQGGSFPSKPTKWKKNRQPRGAIAAFCLWLSRSKTCTILLESESLLDWSGARKPLFSRFENDSTASSTATLVIRE